MNDTNRALNRTVLFLVGLVLIVVGGAAATAVAIPAVGEVWASSVKASDLAAVTRTILRPSPFCISPTPNLICWDT